jgi:hypothetical protein
MRRTLLLAVLFLLARPDAGAAETGEQWTFTLTPYLWLPNVNGTLKYSPPPGGNGAPEVSTGPNNYLENLSAVFMVSGEARKGRWSVLSDFIYLDFNGEKSSVKAVNFGGSTVGTSLDASTKSSFSGLQWTLAGGYALLEAPQASLDVIGGLRYLGIEARSDWQLTGTVTAPGGAQTFPASGSVSRRSDLWDGIVGVRGKVRLGESKWSMPYYLDIGAGSSTLTWQAFLGIAYAFGWGDAVLGYRRLYYDQADDKLLQDFRFSGPSFGASFRF